MKLNISYPATGCQKLVEIEDDMKLRPFYNQRMAAEVPADSLGDEWKGYIFRISGGNDKEGFPMKQGVLTTSRIRLLLREGHSCYRPRRRGERKRKSVRGCIVDSQLSVLCMVIVKKGEQDIPGLTDKTIPRRLGPKRASKIRKLFNLSKDDDVRKYVIRHPVPVKEGQKPRFKHPKIQRLLTPLKLHRRRREQNEKVKRAVRRQEQAAEYAKLLALRMREAKDRRRQRLSSSRASSSSKKAAKAKKAAAAAKTSASATDKKSTLEAKKASVATKKPPSIAKKPTGAAKKPTAAPGAKKPTSAAAKKPTSAPKKPTAAPAKKPTTEAKKPASAAAKKPSAVAKKPTSAVKKPTGAAKKPTSAKKPEKK